MPDASQTLSQLAPQSRVAVIRLRSLGDCVLATPALQLLQTARPDLTIAVVAEPRFASLFTKTLPPALPALREFAPHLCLNLHGGTRSARLTALSGARFKAGFDIFKPACIYNTRIPTAQQLLGVTRIVHTAEHQACAMFGLGVPITEVPRAHVPALPGRHPQAPSQPYAVIHPSAATPEKTWPAASFLALAAQTGLEPVFIAGPTDDLTPFQRYRTLAAAPLPELAQLLREANLFIGNDSGPAHLAAAFGIPQLVLFGPSDERIWHPWRTEYRILKSNPITSITVDQALQSLADLTGS